MLDVHGLSVSYGHHLALDDVALRIEPGEIIVALGANGAGKTTLLKALAGLIAPSRGSRITLNDSALHLLPAHKIVEAGVSLVPEGRHLFGPLSVLENLQLGAFSRRARADISASLELVFGIFPRLSERSSQIAQTMSGGEQQMVAIGRALMSRPEILLLDEPSLGLSPLLTKDLFKALPRVSASGVGILIVEQNTHQSLAIANRVYLLEKGKVVASGAPDAVTSDGSIQKAYLGM